MGPHEGESQAWRRAGAYDDEDDEEEIAPDEIAKRFAALLHLEKDLAANWNVDVAGLLDEYLQLVGPSLVPLSGMVRDTERMRAGRAGAGADLQGGGGENGGAGGSRAKVNFSQAALLIQGSAAVYSRKTDFLHTLVLNALSAFARMGQEQAEQQQQQAKARNRQDGGDDSEGAGEGEVYLTLDDDLPELKADELTLDESEGGEEGAKRTARPPAILLCVEEEGQQQQEPQRLQGDQAAGHGWAREALRYQSAFMVANSTLDLNGEVLLQAEEDGRTLWGQSPKLRAEADAEAAEAAAAAAAAAAKRAEKGKAPMQQSSSAAASMSEGQPPPNAYGEGPSGTAGEGGAEVAGSQPDVTSSDPKLPGSGPEGDQAMVDEDVAGWGSAFAGGSQNNGDDDDGDDGNGDCGDGEGCPDSRTDGDAVAGTDGVRDGGDAAHPGALAAEAGPSGRDGPGGSDGAAASAGRADAAGGAAEPKVEEEEPVYDPYTPLDADDPGNAVPKPLKRGRPLIQRRMRRAASGSRGEPSEYSMAQSFSQGESLNSRSSAAGLPLLSPSLASAAGLQGPSWWLPSDRWCPNAPPPFIPFFPLQGSDAEAACSMATGLPHLIPLGLEQPVPRGRGSHRGAEEEHIFPMVAAAVEFLGGGKKRTRGGRFHEVREGEEAEGDEHGRLGPDMSCGRSDSGGAPPPERPRGDAFEDPARSTPIPSNTFADIDDDDGGGDNGGGDDDDDPGALRGDAAGNSAVGGDGGCGSAAQDAQGLHKEGEPGCKAYGDALRPSQGSDAMHEDGVPGTQSQLEEEPAMVEQLRQKHLNELLEAAARQKEQNRTESERRVADWQIRIQPILQMQEEREAFDIHDWGDRILHTLETVPRAVGEAPQCAFEMAVGASAQPYDVPRCFSAMLQLVNQGNIELVLDQESRRPSSSSGSGRVGGNGEATPTSGGLQLRQPVLSSQQSGLSGCSSGGRQRAPGAGGLEDRSQDHASMRMGCYTIEQSFDLRLLSTHRRHNDLMAYRAPSAAAAAAMAGGAGHVAAASAVKAAGKVDRRGKSPVVSGPRNLGGSRRTSDDACEDDVEMEDEDWEEQPLQGKGRGAAGRGRGGPAARGGGRGAVAPAAVGKASLRHGGVPQPPRARGATGGAAARSSAADRIDTGLGGSQAGESTPVLRNLINVRRDNVGAEGTGSAAGACIGRSNVAAGWAGNGPALNRCAAGASIGAGGNVLSGSGGAAVAAAAVALSAAATANIGENGGLAQYGGSQGVSGVSEGCSPSHSPSPPPLKRSQAFLRKG